MEESKIPELIREGKDRKVIQAFYKNVFPNVKKYIVKNGGISDDAYDIFQDALLFFYKQVIERKFDEKYHVFGYVYRLSLNRWLNKLRKDKRLKILESLNDSMIKTDPESFRSISASAKEENLLEKYFSHIGEKCLKILTYTIYNNLMMEDIVLKMGLKSEGAGKMQLKRCRERLYNLVRENPEIIDEIKDEGW